MTAVRVTRLRVYLLNYTVYCDMCVTYIISTKKVDITNSMIEVIVDGSNNNSKEI
jgi:hypothetical protein